MARAAAPVAFALLGLAGSLAATLALHRAAGAALDRVLAERLRGAGETAASLLEAERPTDARVHALMEANRLEGAYVVSPDLDVLADAAGASGGRADLLRTDAGRVARALAGEETVGRGYDVGEVRVDTGYFPVRGPGGRPAAVLALEAGEAFSSARAALRRALAVAVALSAIAALALALVAARWSRAERRARAAAARAARGDAVARMAAAVAHDIRNPLGIIRAAVDLVRERAGLDARARERLEDVVGEVERLRRLTQDFLELSAEPALHAAPVDLRGVVEEAARGSALLHPALAVRLDVPPLPTVHADAGRVAQVLGNLLANAAQCGAQSVDVQAEAAGGGVRIVVRDDGPGVAPELRERLFDAFATGRAGGTGLGLAVSRRIVERHGGSLDLAARPGPGATFELWLPRASQEE